MKYEIKLFLIFFTFFVVVLCQNCELNEEWKKCGTCESTCQDPNPICLKVCRSPRCMCKKGTVRNVNGSCIPLKQCPLEFNSTNLHSEDCGENEVFAICPCEGTCKTPKRICPSMLRICPNAKPRCQCKVGYARNENKICVLISECSSNNTDGSCGNNEEMRTCPGCEPTCDNPVPVCNKMCILGKVCQCKKEFFRSSEDECVPRDQCPPSTVHPPRMRRDLQCGENEHITECSGCESNCDSLDHVCPMICNNIPTCECQPGYSRDSSIKKCIPTDQCPTSGNLMSLTRKPGRCSKGEKWTECGGCEGSCIQHNPICTLQCRPPGCYCMKGFVRGPNGNCIPRYLCRRYTPKPTPITDQINPCAYTLCPYGTECRVRYVMCLIASCPSPRTECVSISGSTVTATGIPQVSIHNPFCETAKCVNGPCLPVAINCTTLNDCEYIGKCIPRDANGADYDVCKNSTCPIGSKCDPKTIQCFTTPCLNIPRCVKV